MRFDELRDRYRDIRAPRDLQPRAEARFAAAAATRQSAWPAIAAAGAALLAVAVVLHEPREAPSDAQLVMAPATLGGMISDYSETHGSPDALLDAERVALAGASLAEARAAASTRLPTLPDTPKPIRPPTWQPYPRGDGT